MHETNLYSHVSCHVRCAVWQAIVWAVSDQITGYFERRNWETDPGLKSADSDV